MARVQMVSQMPSPLEEAPTDPRLPEHLRETQRNIFAQGKGFDTYQDYMCSQWKDQGPKVDTIQRPFSEAKAIANPIDTPMTGYDRKR
jgi:hypothetical protein